MKFITFITLLTLSATAFSKVDENKESNVPDDIYLASNIAYYGSLAIGAGATLDQIARVKNLDHPQKTYFISPDKNSDGKPLSKSQVKKLKNRMEYYNEVIVQYSTDPEGMRLRDINRLTKKLDELRINSPASVKISELEAELKKIKKLPIDQYLTQYRNGSTLTQGVIFNLKKDKEASKRLVEFLDSSSAKHQRIYSIEVKGNEFKRISDRNRGIVKKALAVALPTGAYNLINNTTEVTRAYSSDSRSSGKDFQQPRNVNSNTQNNAQKAN